jgi:hypothetical protein
MAHLIMGEARADERAEDEIAITIIGDVEACGPSSRKCIY